MGKLYVWTDSLSSLFHLNCNLVYLNWTIGASQGLGSCTFRWIEKVILVSSAISANIIFQELNSRSVLTH
jgi:hypothetical protein